MLKNKFVRNENEILINIYNFQFAMDEVWVNVDGLWFTTD
jgi:hypothetical protein